MVDQCPSDTWLESQHLRQLSAAMTELSGTAIAAHLCRAQGVTPPFVAATAPLPVDLQRQESRAIDSCSIKTRDENN